MQSKESMEVSPMENKQFQSPVYHVIAVPYEKIIPNTYNPNKVRRRK